MEKIQLQVIVCSQYGWKYCEFDDFHWVSSFLKPLVLKGLDYFSISADTRLVKINVELWSVKCDTTSPNTKSEITYYVKDEIIPMGDKTDSFIFYTESNNLHGGDLKKIVIQ